MQKQCRLGGYYAVAYLVGASEALGLSSDGLEIEIRSDLNDKIAEVVKKKGLTLAQVARLAKTSRTCITALMNRMGLLENPVVQTFQFSPQIRFCSALYRAGCARR